jgi:hypothetical protein
MAPFQFLRRRLSRHFGWGRSSVPKAAPPKPAFVRRPEEDWLEAFARWLQSGDAPPRPVDALRSVEQAESRYGLRIPEDFRRYLIDVAPSADMMDDEETNWAGLHRIRSLPEEYEHEIRHPAIAAEAGAYLFFADYMIWCWGWAVCCSDGPNRGRVAVISEPEGFVADSFAGFVERYLHDPVEMAHVRARG